MDQLYGEFNMTFDQIGYVVSVINTCTKSYNYLINLINGDYVFAESAVEKFGFPSARGTDYFAINEKMVHPDDKAALEDDIQQLKDGVKDVHDMKYRWLNTKGENVWISCRGRVIKDSLGRPALLLGRIAELGNEAEADDITGLLKDSRFGEIFDQIRASGLEVHGSVVYMGIDDLRSINEMLGHDFGNHVIRNVASCIETVAGPDNMVYRSSGDGFLLYMPYSLDENDAISVYKGIRHELDTRIKEDAYEAIYTVSAGIVTKLEEMDSYEQIIQYAEFALRIAKHHGRNTFAVFEHKAYDDFMHRSMLRKRMHKDIQNDFQNFDLYFQPIVDGVTHKVCGAEALLRWRHEDGSFVPPSEFIPILEESGHIVPVGNWVMKTAIAVCSDWIKHNPDFHISVNLSYVQLEKSDVAESISDLLEASGLPPESLTIELTESGYVETGRHFLKFHSKAKSMGCHIAIDDFGSGYSNFRYINDIKANMLKIDRSFTARAIDDEHDFKLISNIVEMSHSLGIKVCIEGVETAEELQRISVLGPDYYQGYFFGRPSNRKDFEEKFLEDLSVGENVG